MNRFPRHLVCASALLAAAPAAALEIEAIYTNIPDHPTAQVPGVPGAQFRAPAVPFLTLHGSPDGQHWIFKAFTDDPDSGANDVIVTGSGGVGTVAAQEGQPSPLAGLTYGFMDSDCGINNSGRYAFGNRLSGGPTTTDEVVFTFDGDGLVVAFREGDAAPGLVDPAGAGDELFGNSLNSTHVLGDGTVACKADLIQNIDSDFESALYHGSSVEAQEGTTIGQILGPDVYDSFVGLSGNTFSSTPDGLAWIVEADVLAGLGTEEAVILTGNIAIRDGDSIPGLPGAVASIFAVDMLGNGDWLVRGADTDGRDFAARNGEAIAVNGLLIADGETEAWADIHTVNGNSSGDYVVGGETDTGDDVIVLNGQQVLARTGDPVALPTEGPLTEAFLGTLAANDAFLSDDLNDDKVDDRELYAFASLQDELGADLGDAFIVVRLAQQPVCPWDCGDGDGTVGTPDFLELLAQWGTSGSCDFDGGGVGTPDFLELLANWGGCPE